MELWKWVLSVAAAAMVGILVWLGVFNRESVDPSSFNVERGSWVIFQDGVQLGVEDFFLSTTDRQVDLHSTVSLSDGARFTQRYRLNQSLRPVRYFRDSFDVTNKQTVLVEVSGSQVQIDLFGGGQAQQQNMPISDAAMLLDTQVYSHYMLLYRRIQGWAPGVYENAMISPQAMDTLTLEINPPTTATLKHGAQLLQVQRQEVVIGKAPVWLFSDSGRLIAVSLVDQGKFIYRSDLFPDGLEAL